MIALFDTIVWLALFGMKVIIIIDFLLAAHTCAVPTRD